MSLPEDIWREKYRYGNEQNLDDTLMRIYRQFEKDARDRGIGAEKFRKVFEERKFIPAGRILANYGTDADNVTMSNCYVSPVIGDDFIDIMEAFKDSMTTLRYGGGIGMDFSTIRPKGALVKGCNTYAKGPLAFMDVWNAGCATVDSKGGRRGAMMGILRCDHPDILDFIKAKREPGRLANFNLSVAVTDKFLEAVKNDDLFDLVFEGTVYDTIRARELWDTIMRSNYEYAEPGVIFIDRINEDNNLRYCEEISATNPCGEQPLGPNGACLLGSINLTACVKDPFTKNAYIDMYEVAKATSAAVNFLDIVIDVQKYPTEAQRQKAMNTRRMGIGIVGLGSAMAMVGVRYGSEESVELTKAIMSTVCNSAYLASAELARLLGTFPDYSHEEYTAEDHPIMNRLNVGTINAIKANGLRNSHLTSIAPNGNMGLVLGVVTGGIEPIFMREYKRKVLQLDGSHKEEIVRDYAWDMYLKMKEAGEVDDSWEQYFVTTSDLTVDDHLVVMAAAASYVDSAISKTINVPKDYDFDDFKDVYDKACLLGLKGCTTYRPNDILGSVLSEVDDDKETNGDTGEEVASSTDDLLVRPQVVSGKTTKLKWNGNNYYVTVNKIGDRPVEVFINSDVVGDMQWRTALCKTLSAVFRREKDISFIIKDLKSITDPSGGQWQNGKYLKSIVEAIGIVIEDSVSDSSGSDEDAAPAGGEEKLHGGSASCYSCGSNNVKYESGCFVCNDCGESKCG